MRFFGCCFSNELEPALNCCMVWKNKVCLDFGPDTVDLNLTDDLILKSCATAMKSHKNQEKPYRFEKHSHKVIFGFPGRWSVDDWMSNANASFGDEPVDIQIFPSLKHVGLNKVAKVNGAFLKRFKAVLAEQRFKEEVDEAVKDGKKVVFTGHSNGGAIAILATCWFLEQYIRPDPKKLRPLCVTFGSPLVGDHLVTHAINRENWSRHFIHFVMSHDIVSRISLCPLSSIELQLLQILCFLKSPLKENPGDYLGFFETVVGNASSVTNYAVSKMTGCTNPLLEIVSGFSFTELCPYKPSGTYVFCTGSGKLVVVKNSDAVLQLFFYLLQLNSTDSITQVAQRSLKCHLDYEGVLTDCLKMISISHLDHLDSLPLSSDLDNVANATANKALNDLGVSTRARLCLRAAGDLEKLKQENMKKLDQKKEDKEKGFKKIIEKLEKYKNEHTITTYYDSFKAARSRDDFEAKVCQLQLAGMWDEIVYMIKRYELPDGFECRKDWIELGTRYRRLVEPIDIANYYRQSLNKDTGPYMGRGRPKRYKCAQRWLEHAERMQDEALESCLWAEVEELWDGSNDPGVKDKVLSLVNKVQKWIDDGALDNHMYLEDSTFRKLLEAHNLTGRGIDSRIPITKKGNSDVSLEGEG